LLFYRFLAWKTRKYGLSLKGIIDSLSEIRITLVKDTKSNKSDIVLEEMNATQGSLFSFLNLGKFIKG
jgi:transposase